LPDTRSHRGPDPRDHEAFRTEAWPALRGAVADLSWLLGRGYAWKSSLKLVGDRWALTERQRLAVARGSCSDAALARRLAHQVPAGAVRDESLEIDGFNLLTTVEAALGGAVVLRGRDGCDRDLAGVHGTYRRVGETLPAIDLLGGLLEELGVARVCWLLDSPVSNSGRLRGLLLEAAKTHAWDWHVDLVPNPDPLLTRSQAVVVTADSVILDGCARWLNLARLAIESRIPQARVVSLDT
jgi:hypothetical protein